MKNYNQLSEEERNIIFIMLNRGKSIRDIGRELSRNPGTISREVKKNHGRKMYRANRSHVRALSKQQNSHKRVRLKSHALRIEVEKMLMNRWSPEIIANRLCKKTNLPKISPEAIYQWIYYDAQYLIDCLVRAHPNRWPKGKSKKLRFIIKDRVHIAQRPIEANNRSQFGHWEADLIVGKGRSALQVAVDRKSRFTKLAKIPDKSAAASSAAIKRNLYDKARKSITYDNGSENASHVEVDVYLGTQSFFCEPFHSWEKGTVENTNGLIRRFLPKKTNFDTINDSIIQQVESWLNNRPRKCLDYLTPAESFASGVALGG